MQTYLGALAALLMLAACGQPTAQQTQAPAADVADASGKPGAPTSSGTPQSGAPPTREQLVGRWGDNGDCNFATVLNADGSYTMPDGSAGRWTLDGDRMTMSGAGGAFTVQVSILNDHQLLIGNPNGSIGLSQRCP